MARSVESRSYNPSQAIVFHKTNERFGGLSNMAPGFPLQVNSTDIRTSEALYQACRFPHLPQVQQLILAEKSPMTAKMHAKKYRSDTRSDWDGVRISIMRWSLRAKLVQNQVTFGELLLATEHLPIVEYSTKDDFWGAKPKPSGMLVGKNILGRLLMELRELYRTNVISFNQLTPLNIPDFRLIGRPIQTLKIEHDSYTEPEYIVEVRQAGLF